jgi:glucuronate isomerase
LPYTLRNPLYHWTHLELKRAFGITERLNVKTAHGIWKRANAALEEGLTARAILRKFNVIALFTTDDPVDDLAAHRRIVEEDSLVWLDGRRRRRYEGIDVPPTFRPDRALKIDQLGEFLSWLRKLEEASNTEMRNLATFLDALSERHAYFAEVMVAPRTMKWNHARLDRAVKRPRRKFSVSRRISSRSVRKSASGMRHTSRCIWRG